MALIPKNTNPLLDYLNGNNAAMSVDGLVVDGVYGVNGVINTIGTNTQSYQDPVTGQISNTSVLTVPFTPSSSQWISNIVDDAVNTTYQLSFNFNRNTFINYVSFNILQVPCTWTLYQGSIGSSNQISTGIISAYNTENYQNVEIKFPSTYQFSTTVSLILVLNKSLTGTQYTFGVSGFQAKLIVEQYSDLQINNTTVSGITTQNNLGFVETYSPVSYSLTNILPEAEPDIEVDSEAGEYWKCAPQPTGDSIVYFIVDLGSLQFINKMYLDPLYSSSVFNLYYSYDNNLWYPVQRDFRLKKGIYDLPTVFARYLKFEFTQLIPEPYNLPFDSIQRTINVFPDWVDNYFTNIERAIPDIANQNYALSSALAPNVAYNRQLSSYTTYGTSITNLNGSVWGSDPNPTTQPTNNNNNTTITDPTISYKTLQDVAGTGSAYSPISDPAFITRRFPFASTHIYKQVNVNQTWHQAYFTGLKSLLFYNTNQAIQSDYYEFTDYFLSNISTSTIVSGTGTTATFKTPSPVTVTVSGVTSTVVSGGGYTGTAGKQLLTQNLQTYTQFNSFKIASLSSDWVPFLSNNQTLLLGNLSTLGITTSGLTTSNLTPNNSNYGLWSFTPSGNTSPIQTYVQSPIAAGGQNLLTAAESAMISGTGWRGPMVGRTTAGTISGVTPITVPLVTNIQSSYGHGEDVYGNETFGTPTSLGIANPNNYTFLVTASGVGTISTYVTYSGVGVSVISGTSFTISGTSNLNFFTTQPLGTTVASVVIAASGGASFTLSNAGFYLGVQNQWSTPLVTSGMRISATARIYLPNTNNGTYRCGLYSNSTELAHVQFSNIPLRTWVDIEVPFTLVSGYYNYNNFSARLTQTNGRGEVYESAMLGVFYNPVTWEYCTDGSGAIWNWITTGINNANANIGLRAPTNQIQLRGTLIQDGSQISALTVLPNYTQNPYYTTTPINYIGDPKTNELSWRRTPAQRPLFQLRSELHPADYDIDILMNINNPYTLD